MPRLFRPLALALALALAGLFGCDETSDAPAPPPPAMAPAPAVGAQCDPPLAGPDEGCGTGGDFEWMAVGCHATPDRPEIRLIIEKGIVTAYAAADETGAMVWVECDESGATVTGINDPRV
ncbi:MAG: hypothetical protein EKK55_24360 [Rhodocyclaceae bacterium]|nr:MAG: hypothetical protein EKK55_24360 [Rhodocyclaceae bacterium]